MTIHSRQNAIAWLTLLAMPGLGPVRLQALLDALGSAPAILHAPDQAWRAAGLPPSVIAGRHSTDQARVAAAIAWLEADPRHHLITWDDPNYPPLLKELHDAPPVLFAIGDVSLLAQPQLAIVGSRHPTTGGRKHARAFSQHLSRCGMIITSGLAQGVDAEAHIGALRAGSPTIAVMGTGPDIVYPRAHRQLAADIVDRGGLLLSEYLPGTGPHRDNFPRRNRIISGLSLGTLVVEASVKSGSLITARLASEQGREVFAIPGSIHNPLARGCHRLIRDGAKLVETADDILEELSHKLHGYLVESEAPGRTAGSEAPETAPACDPEYAALLAHLGYDPLHIDELVESSGLTPEAVSSMLLMLELDGQVESLPDGRYVRILKHLAE